MEGQGGGLVGAALGLMRIINEGGLVGEVAAERQD